MSNAILPTAPGLAWGIGKSPVWSTQVRDSVSGRQYALSRRLYPTWRFKLPFEVLRAKGTWQELEALVGFINSRKGRYDDFLYQDPRDYQVTAQAFGTGDGATKTFALVRSVGGFIEPVGAVNTGATTVFVGGVGTGVTYDANLANVTFAAAPGVGVALTWTGQFYYRCRFEKDEISFEQFMQDLWKAGAVEFRTFRP